VCSPDLVDFSGHHVTAKEVADSMKPGGWLHTSVIEVGIQSIRMNMPENNKKVIMPLRVAVSLILSIFFLYFLLLH
jgi:hypothetical protein